MVQTTQLSDSPLLKEDEKSKVIVAVFKAAEEDQVVGPPLTLPVDITPQQLTLVLNQLLKNDESVPYTFLVDETEIVRSVAEDVFSPANAARSMESTLVIHYQPQAIFRVRAVTRCTSTLAGHAEAILNVQFSPNGLQAASSSGDTTVRIYDLTTETPQHVCRGHKHWVLCLAWRPDSQCLASGGMDKGVWLWDPRSGEPMAHLQGHTQWITSIAWEPFHLRPTDPRLATASKDGTVRVWNTRTRVPDFILSQHTGAVTCVKWSGEGFLYTASRDQTIRVWNAQDGTLVRILKGHAHWINSMALSTEHVMRMGPFDFQGHRSMDVGEAQVQSRERYLQARGEKERLVSGSDDFTLCFWYPTEQAQPIARLTGHQQLVNHVCFSPDGRWFASASFDKSVKLWDGYSGKFVTTLRGHVQAVYQVTFSADSRLLISGSKDSTLKVWDMRTKKRLFDLPGHADEVFTVDWCPVIDQGSRVMSGGKDRQLKFWRQ